MGSAVSRRLVGEKRRSLCRMPTAENRRPIQARAGRAAAGLRACVWILPAAPAASSASATTAAATTTTESTAAAAALTTAAFGSRPRFVDVQAPALQIGAIQRGDRSLGFFLTVHLDEAEALRLTAELVFDDRRRIDLPVRRENLAQLHFGDLIGQVPHVNLHALSLFCLVAAQAAGSRTANVPIRGSGTGAAHEGGCRGHEP